MNGFQIFAEPWWVNLLIFIPIISFFYWRESLSLSRKTLVTTLIFSLAFGFVEAAVVIYLRAITGTVPSSNAGVLSLIPSSIFSIEFFREVATIIMLGTLAMLSAKKLKEQAAIFLWVFAIWDIAYYFWLWLIVKWPPSLLSPDVLFLIPMPWISQVWFPLLVSALTIGTVIARNKR